MNNVKLILSEKEKYVKGTNQGSDEVKNIFYHYRSIGLSQIWAKSYRYKKLQKLAAGVIHIDDYIDNNTSKALDLVDFKQEKKKHMKIEFFPIVPILRRAILGETDKRKIKVDLRVINKENVNDYIETVDNAFRESLVNALEAKFNGQEVTEEVQQKKAKELQTIYTTNFRTTIEEWGNHTMRIEDQKFDMEEIYRKIVDKIFIHNDPAVHTMYSDGYYKPEILPGEKIFSLRSPNSEDYSESQMFGWVNELNIGSVLNKWGSELSEKDVEKLEEWKSLYTSGFVLNGHFDDLTGNRTRYADSKQNYLKFKEKELQGEEDNEGRYGENSNLIKETHMYFLLPRKKGLLYSKISGTEHRTIVDETFKISYKPVYKKGFPKSEYSLLEGEHVEWFYENELWYGCQLELNNSVTSSNTAMVSGNSLSENNSVIWIKLQKHDIQYRAKNQRFGVCIPVHGGPIDNEYNQNSSPTQKSYNYQVIFNWIWNRSVQLLKTEIGRFFYSNPGSIPTESLEGSYGKDDLMNFMLQARDLGIVAGEEGINNTGNPNFKGAGQVIDLNRTNDILEKLNLANIVRQECFKQLGLTEDYLLGNIQPRMSSKMVAQGMQRSSNQIQWIFTRLNSIIKRLRTTMLQTAQHIGVEYGESFLSYNYDSKTKHIFNIDLMKLNLAHFDAFITNSVSDMDVLQRFKEMTMNDNTSGFSGLERMAVEMSETLPETYEKVKKLQKEKELREDKIRQENLKLQQDALQQKEMAEQRQIQMEMEKDRLDREKDIMVAQIRAVGYGEGDPSDISKEILAMQEENAQQKQFYENLLNNNKEVTQKEEKDKDRIHKEKVDNRKLAHKDRELDIREQEAKNANNRNKILD